MQKYLEGNQRITKYIEDGTLCAISYPFTHLPYKVQQGRYEYRSQSSRDIPQTQKCASCVMFPVGYTLQNN